jgi:1-acyl-sn-glycerol-3-phosphate acyltransferase
LTNKVKTSKFAKINWRIHDMLRAYLFLLFFVPWTLFCAFCAMLSTIVDKSGRSFHRFALLWSRVGLFVAGVELAVEGTELVPRGQPLIFMGNHQSNFDVLALFQAVPVRFNWLAKEELFKIPVFGRSIRCAGYIPIDRSDGRKALGSLKRAAEIVKGGTSVAIFPEGTRSNDGELLPFKRGGFMLGVRAGVPIVPFSIRGSMAVNPPDNFLMLRKGTIRVRFSEPIPVKSSGSEVLPEIMEKVRKAIAAGLES